MYLHGIGATYHTYENTTICFIGLNWEILCKTENVSLRKATNLYMLTLRENPAMQGHLPDTLNFHFAASHRKNSLSNKGFVSIISTGYQVHCNAIPNACYNCIFGLVWLK